MKKLKLFAFSLITILCFGLISVNAEKLTVENEDDYAAAIKNNAITEIELGANIPVDSLNGASNEDVIRVNRNIVLDLNGKIITTGDYATITAYYDGNYTLTIKNGKINSACNSHCSTAPIVILNTDNCDTANANCDSKLVLEDLTISTSNKSYDYLMNISSPENESKYNVEISNVILENVFQATELFAHNFGYNSADPILNLNIKSMRGSNVHYINEDSEYKVKDILDPTTSELLVNGNVITDLEMKISKYDVSAGTGFEIRQKSVIDITFDDTKYGYSNVNAKPITIKNNNSTSMQIKSVIVNNLDKFTVSGNTQPTIAEGSTDDSSFVVKPVDGLGVGEHTAIITVTDMDDTTYTANVKFIVNKADITPSVSIEGWLYEDTANDPSVTGNDGNGAVIYEYKVQDASDSTYSTVVPTNAGKYTLRATIDSSTNYNGGVAKANFIIEYKVTDGDGQKNIIGKKEDAVFKINADKDLFLKAYLNGEELNSEFYTITEGSTIITLKQSFLNNLLPNTYNLKATFSDGGEANTTFVISLPTENNPKTDDSLMLSIILASVSLIGFLATQLYFKNENA